MKNNIRIGFTGTRQGMSVIQRERFAKYIEYTNIVSCITEFHHGDCIGSDAQTHDIIAKFFPGIQIVIHPPIKSNFRAFRKSKISFLPADYLKRNRSIVDSTDILIATPLEDKEKKKGGTWYTIRYARKKGRKVIIL